MYSIIDIETTGNGIKGNKITEISIFNFDGKEIVDEFTSLVNPECEIPYFITGLTGIDDTMVRDAPKWEEIADKVLEMTQDTIFVAHSVNFDYNVIKNEFLNIGITYTRKKLCTVRLSRKLIPGFNSYSLGKLCSSLNIPLTDRHRARGDAHATVLLFKRLITTEGAEAVFKTFLNSRSQEATLPPGLPKEDFEKLPNSAGIYYFRDKNGAIIYIGKAINIKKRVLGHFYNKSNKENLLCKATHQIDYELSGSELVALLMESDAIKQHYPKFNISQKRNSKEYAIFTYKDRNNITHIAYNNVKMVADPICTFNNITECRSFLEELCQSHKLCPKFCHLQENTLSCSHYSISSCQGICREKETNIIYNKRVEEAIKEVKEKNLNIIITEEGRQPNEKAFVLINDGQYKGFGFIEKSEQITSLEDLEIYLERKKENLDTKRIIAGYLKKFPQKSIPLSQVSI
ncbi:exonuclease domain-containing protein [Arenibacter latericius]|uniref:exonuclease domain-containing protein n=1 Tax=Arenibacter latericius TaxID=86104 RepID=UPI00041658FD|nr:exonuclease domain-containing protein [Arenibacter latericius]MDX1362595.1 exonuclease domain-containing protein [Arenibacter latericius]